MNTTEPCFNSDKGLMMWQEKNCLQCKKAVWYNQRLQRMPQYRCAIQKQIEAQAAGEKEINERTYKATRSNVCPMLKGKEVEKQATHNVLDFSQGQSMVETAVTKEEHTEASTPEDRPTPQESEAAEENDKVRWKARCRIVETLYGDGLGL